MPFAHTAPLQGAINFDLNDLKRLVLLRRIRVAGDYLSLTELAGAFRLAPEELNLIIDALQGRPVEAAFASLVRRGVVRNPLASLEDC